ncbi:MAG: hypothetical protein A2Z21_09705 [Candidatus Fraserbacteria bacterium RBG_16_55_9]|uniref:Uncharacterized protein n=1 Tax=Fraserbacteria sp. (strain RBG_16_55_9) TaxID=1817864 RepID=A0A1F5UQ12_FRAXR|nr:MAG: hypothetical protein A2Z21_09705 [Candidatus Fraserbacteria bacterium RBG_16_55_9]
MNESWGQRLRSITLATGLLLLSSIAGLLLWRVWPLLMALPDLLYWSILVVVLAMAALSVALRERKGRAHRVRERMTVMSQRRNVGRVQELVNEITGAEQSNFLQNKLRQDLRGVAFRVVAIRQGVPEGRARERVNAGDWSGHARLEQFLRDNRPMRVPILTQLAHKLLGRHGGNGQFQQLLQKAVQSLEDYSREEPYDDDHQRQHAD